MQLEQQQLQNAACALQHACACVCAVLVASSSYSDARTASSSQCREYERCFRPCVLLVCVRACVCRTCWAAHVHLGREPAARLVCNPGRRMYNLVILYVMLSEQGRILYSTFEARSDVWAFTYVYNSVFHNLAAARCSASCM